jgi:hypothetical protein
LTGASWDRIRLSDCLWLESGAYFAKTGCPPMGYGGSVRLELCWSGRLSDCLWLESGAYFAETRCPPMGTEVFDWSFVGRDSPLMMPVVRVWRILLRAALGTSRQLLVALSGSWKSGELLAATGKLLASSS